MWLLALTLLGCPDKGANDTGTPSDDSGSPEDSGDDGGLDPETVPLAGACAAEVDYGNFTIDANEDYAYVTGTVTDGVVPATILTELDSAGGCTIWRRENPFCDPSCEPGYTCDFDGTCVPYPVGQDLGTVTGEGLLEPVSMEPVVPGNAYFDTSVPNPPWAPGSVVTVSSTGGVYDAFTLHGVAPDELVLGSLSWTLGAGEPLLLSWDPPTSSTRAQVRVTLQIDQHGTTPSTVVCWMEDTGEGEVPAEIVDSLRSLGLSGFPNGSAARLTADSTAVGEGCADLWLSSSLVPTVSVSGYTPCTNDADCPDGQECNEEMERCE